MSPRSPSNLVLLTGKPGGAGRVTLVGAGPGDPELLTVKALKALARADVVVHDGLVSDDVLALAPAGSRRISVAKRKSRHSYSQGEIDRLLVAFAREGLEVVRLKGGDPFIFARGGEELEACRAAGVRCEIIPGVTAAFAASAGAGAPLTHRGAAQSVTFATAHGAGGETPDLDWPALARANQTVVIYMGRSKAGEIAGRLMAAGREGSTPALAVENASLASERRIATTLAELGGVAEELAGPTLLIVGEAMAMAVAAPLPAFGRTPPRGGRDSLRESPPVGVGEGDREAGEGVRAPLPAFGSQPESPSVGVGEGDREVVEGVGQRRKSRRGAP